jgi:uncharacterized protein
LSPFRLLLLLSLFLIEALAVVAAFQIVAPIECQATEIELACRALRGGFVSGLCAMTGFGVYVWARRPAWRRFCQLVQQDTPRGLWIGLHVLGVAVIFLPLVVLDPARLNQDFARVFLALLTGAGLAGLGAAFWLLPPRGWRDWLRAEAFLPLVIVGLAALIPLLALLVEPLWAIEVLAAQTFQGVAFLLHALGLEVIIDPVRAWIGLPGFVVAVASQCSGIEGFALITGFMGLYAILFREGLRQGMFWGVLWPIALLASGLFNILRITVLILIGRYVSPELAVNGFHSFAGWLLFTLLGLGVLVAAQALPMLHKGPRTPLGLRQDPAVALILPFIAFMLSGVVAQAFWQVPAQGYPLQVAVMLVAVLAVWRPLIAQLGGLRLDPVAGAIGLAVGVLWVGMSPQGDEARLGLSALSAGAMLVWAVARVVGTVLLVPLIEEAFFRGYIMAQLDRGLGGSLWARGVAIAVSTALFALMHGRLVLAGIAGVFFAIAMLRRGRLGDAVVAHMVANATVAAAAWYLGRWSLI